MELVIIQILLSFFLLFALELLLGIDNILFIAIVSKRLPKKEQRRARKVGLSLALITRLALLASLSWMMSLTVPLFSLWEHPFSGKDLLLLGGGLFLIAKSSLEIQEKADDQKREFRLRSQFVQVLIQIILLDMLFSIDSIITAVGLVNELPVMAAAVVASTVVMICASHTVADLIDRYPSVRFLALSFLTLIGVGMISDALGGYLPKGYIYFAMVYSLIVEILGSRFRKRVTR